jgi:hypothetical protein
VAEVELGAGFERPVEDVALGRVEGGVEYSDYDQVVVRVWYSASSMSTTHSPRSLGSLFLEAIVVVADAKRDDTDVSIGIVSLYEAVTNADRKNRENSRSTQPASLDISETSCGCPAQH